LTQNEPSRFIDELPEQYLDRAYANGNMRNNPTNHWNAFDKLRGAFAGAAEPKKTTSKPSYLNTNAVIQVKEHTPSADFAPSDTSNLQQGQKVEHQKFGFGEVIRMEGASHNPIATVRFEHNGDKKIMLNYAKLRIIAES
jgi:DNA helicase-2/ATP-dependent DNA helicase PcrA